MSVVEGMFEVIKGRKNPRQGAHISSVFEKGEDIMLLLGYKGIELREICEEFTRRKK